MERSFFVLLFSTFFIAVIHALAPDHWMPFIMIGNAQKWSKTKLMTATFLAGLGHVGSSIILGVVGIALGIGLLKIKGIVESVAKVGGILLIGFGIFYMLWGLKHMKDEHTSYLSADRDKLNKKRGIISTWTLIAIFVLGPCEALIPLMFIATFYGWLGIVTITLSFSVMTILMMMVQTILAYVGIQKIHLEALHKFSHAIAGAIIALTGIIVMILGI